jgi:hypothetical protein
MVLEDPAQRPTSADALSELRKIREETPPDVLSMLLKPIPPQTFSDEELRALGLRD